MERKNATSQSIIDLLEASSNLEKNIDDDDHFRPKDKKTFTLKHKLIPNQLLRLKTNHYIGKIVLATLSLLFFIWLIFNGYRFTRSSSPKIVMVLAVNNGGGVERWKTPEEWSLERTSIANKKDYAERHGYALTLKDTTLKRRYSHEWREGWERVDILRQTMREYPEAEWFWWLDQNTFIMEPEIDLTSYLLRNIDKKAYRTINYFNPQDITAEAPYVDTTTSPINMIITQDCNGFNLNSFLIRKSEWSELLLDAWWDPVLYEQMHMVWERREASCLEVLYSHQPWIRESMAFVPIKAINSLTKGNCWDQKDDKTLFYNKNDRDFLVNLDGCNNGDRSCWNEFEYYKKLRNELHKAWYKFW